MSIPFLSLSYSYQFPFVDMSERFGSNSTIGAGFTYKTQNNILWGIDWNFLFSNNVKYKDTLFKAISFSQGDMDINILNGAGQPAIINIYERGHIIMFRAGKIFDVWAHNPNSGLFLTGGLGLFTHKIRIEVYQNDTPQLDPDYRKGYDRCSVGPVTGIQLGYIYFNNNRLINFKAEIEAYYGLTHSIRAYNFDTMSKDTNWRHDVLVGLKVSWIIPLYPKAPKDFYYD
ncbi:MAG: hypothetical protein LBP67_08730 [Bacteroidales bacterium]|nr:hypothetical protein [Bacteroidales bacterium]